MTDIQKYITRYLRNAGCKCKTPSEKVSDLAKIAEKRKGELVALITKAINNYKPRKGQGKDSDAFQEWFDTTGKQFLTFMSQYVANRDAESLYTLIRLSELLKDSLDAAKAEGKEAFNCWIIEALDQFHQAFAQQQTWNFANSASSWRSVHGLEFGATEQTEDLFDKIPRRKGSTYRDMAFIKLVDAA